MALRALRNFQHCPRRLSMRSIQSQPATKDVGRTSHIYTRPWCLLFYRDILDVAGTCKNR